MENRIKEIMQNKAIKAADLAEKVGISKVSMYNILNNKQEPSANTLLTISECLSVPFWQLFVDPEEIAGKEELNALITHQGKFYEARTLEGLKDIVKTIEANP